MSVPLLLEHFDELISTPEDVEKLNCSILTLAIYGELNTQDSNDVPASQLLSNIRNERERLVELGKIADEDSLLIVQDKEKPFELPDGWVWTRVGEVCTIRGGKRVPKGYDLIDTPSKHIYIRVTDMKDGTISDRNLKYITDDVFEFIKRYLIEKDDLYITIAGTIGAVGSVPEKFHMMNLTENAARITPHCVDRQFLKYALSSQFVQDQLQDKVNQMAQPKLALTRIKTTLLPLPPLAEQQRIVARVEELFAQTRLLAEQLSHSRTELDRLNESALAHLLASETQEEFNERWCFIAEHFDLLTSAPEHIAPLRQSILELAVRGKLTRREAGDEPAKELLKRIKEEKSDKEKLSKPIDDDEKSFDLPRGWEWVRLKEITIYLQTGPFGSNLHKSDYVSDGTPVVNPVNMRDGKITINKGMLISEKTLKRLSQYILETGDLVLARRGEIGRCALVTEREKGWLCGTGSLRLRVSKNISSAFMVLLFKTNFARNQLSDQTVGITMSNMSQTALENLTFALPPLAEQERIVKRVEQLLGWCDALEAQLADAERERGRLVESVLAGVGG